MNAWIDCMENAALGERCLHLELKDIMSLKARLPDVYEAINERSAFIDYRSAESGGESVIALCCGNN
jgi:hypothetical protein